ncbi:unnamed protein product [Enterobius vermicularis]|uniref:RRM domain-containing protein n=1 Tax=Enterobius vermicularis TaxID=51028 RepID=A0A0N4V3A8_ENTVE|nr:unnamed protein product [Enterobius vermicularis]
MGFCNDSTLDLPILDTDYKIHIGSGGIPVELLFPGEYCSLFVGSRPINWSSEKGLSFGTQILKHFSKYGCVTQFLRFSDAEQEFIGHPCLIRMESKTAALKAFESGDMVFDSQVWEVKPAYHIWPEEKKADRVLKLFEFVVHFRRLPVPGLCILKVHL